MSDVQRVRIESWNSSVVMILMLVVLIFQCQNLDEIESAIDSNTRAIEIQNRMLEEK